MARNSNSCSAESPERACVASFLSFRMAVQPNGAEMARNRRFCIVERVWCYRYSKSLPSESVFPARRYRTAENLPLELDSHARRYRSAKNLPPSWAGWHNATAAIISCRRKTYPTHEATDNRKTCHQGSLGISWKTVRGFAPSFARQRASAMT